MLNTWVRLQYDFWWYKQQHMITIGGFEQVAGSFAYCANRLNTIYYRFLEQEVST